MNTAGSKIRFVERLGYGIGDFASNLIYAAITSFLLFYYTDVAGLASGIIGTIMFLTRVFDAFVDVGVGILVDKTRSKHGKARPWLLWMCVPFGIVAFLLFSVPDIGSTGKLIYVVVTYLLVNIIFSAINIPYGVLGTLISQDQYQRTVLNIFRMFLSTVCSVMMGVYVLPIVNTMGGGRAAWSITFAIFGVLSIVLFIVTFLTTKERVTPSATTTEAMQHVPVKKGVAALFKNKYWVMMLVFMVIAYITNGLGGANVYFARYVLGDEGLMGMITICSLVPMLLGMFLVAPLVKRTGKRNAMIAGSMISSAGLILMMIHPTSILLVMVGLVVKSLGMAPMAGSMWAMLADTVEYGEWKTGIRNEGLVYSAGSFGTKVGSGLGAALIGWILAWGGYVAEQAQQTSTALISLQALFIYIPLIFNILMIVILIFYKLDREYPVILKELQDRNMSGHHELRPVPKEVTGTNDNPKLTY
ncbi:MFS transporter [Paenibacillus sp. JX-17]|uniref:MFS transporter n=1 Tax=Paenibacillus lacisoli TaxID=3064525 RepID=A0ABT9CFD0_9BACL|nr:MFS transporter [Paenibacillus sp. JX-17]MDO7907983.1 MFS transporter [Paenibacillus sp. JX-17]